MEYAAEYKIDTNPRGVSAIAIRGAIDRILGLRDFPGIESPGMEFKLGVAYDLLYIGGGLEGEARQKHIHSVDSHGIVALIDSDVLLRVEPLTARVDHSSLYTSLVIRVGKSGAKLVTSDLIEKLKVELSD